jgi:phthalate 4,5-dioxygenase oxygenase subunit
MLNREDNELLTRVGPGTPMGNLMREYWQPILFSSELAANDGEPLRVRHLSENLIAFRDSTGTVGLVDNHCPHRGAGLFFGRNEEEGLRCVYHGWKFDTSGACVDMPNEPPESNFRNKVRVKAYPCVERNGLIWTYMGSRQTPPPLPNMIWNTTPENPPFIWRHLRQCNWMQALEGDIDTSHLNFLHTRLDKTEQTTPRNARPGAVAMARYNQDPHPRLEVVDTDYGVMYAGRRACEPGSAYWRISQFLFPFWTMPTGGAVEVGGKAWLPIDDENTMVLEFRWDPAGPPSDEEKAKMQEFRNPYGYLPQSSDWLGRWRLAANKSNNYHFDYELQRTKLYFGVKSNPLQDGAVQETMGAIYDRTRERLGTTDAAIIRVRRRLIAAARALQDDAVTPPIVDQPDAYRVRNHWAILPEQANWIESTRELVRDFSW